MEERRHSGAPAPTGPCGEARLRAETACEQAQQLRGDAQQAAAALQAAKRELNAAELAEARAGEAAEARGIAAAKIEARETYRRSLAHSTTGTDRQRAAGAWLREIDRLNRTARSAARTLAEARRHGLDGKRAVDEAERQADAARIRAESAARACLEARSLVAACEERVAAGRLSSVGPVMSPKPASAEGRAGGGVEAQGGGVGTQDGGEATRSTAGQAHTGPGPQAAPHAEPASAARQAGAGAVPGSQAARPYAPGSFGASGPSDDAAVPEIAAVAGPAGATGPLVVESLIEGERSILQELSRQLSEITGHAPSHYLLLLQELIDAIVETAAERRYVTFDRSYLLWRQFETDESRTILGALADLGFRVEPGRGWYGGRAPVSSDLAMALAYAGYDARTVRGLPPAVAIADLPSTISVSAIECLADLAPELTVSQMADLLGPRAEALNDLWDDWGRLRPMLLSETSVVGT